MAKIVVQHLRGSRTGTREIYPTTRFGSLFIGRDVTADVQFDPFKDDLVSRSHAVIEWDEDIESTLTITDLLSSNGTYLNGARVLSSTRLSSGDVIELGAGGPEFRVLLEGLGEMVVDQTGEVTLERRPVKSTRPMRAVPDKRDPRIERTRRR